MQRRPCTAVFATRPNRHRLVIWDFQAASYREVQTQAPPLSRALLVVPWGWTAAVARAAQSALRGAAWRTCGTHRCAHLQNGVTAKVLLPRPALLPLRGAHAARARQRTCA